MNRFKDLLVSGTVYSRPVSEDDSVCAVLSIIVYNACILKRVGSMLFIINQHGEGKPLVITCHLNFVPFVASSKGRQSKIQLRLISVREDLY